MAGKAGCFLLSLIWFVQVAQDNSYPVWVSTTLPGQQLSLGIRPVVPAKTSYTKSLRFAIYSFTIVASDSGRTRNLRIKAYRGDLLLTNFTIPVDGAVVGADVADLDANRFPELYVYSTTDGSGSFGRVYAWQFLPERKADITLPNWRNLSVDGYMGHDSLWVERTSLCRKFPIYHDGDANATPSGGYQRIKYQLKTTGLTFALVPEKQ